MLAKGDKQAAKDWYEAVTKSVKAQIPTPAPSQSSAGYSPTFDTSKVVLKPGTDHTPNRLQPDVAETLPKAAVPDFYAELGSSDNPHVFERNNQIDWATYGAMHTNQDKEAWGSKAAYGHVYGYTEGTADYNRLSAPPAGSPPGTFSQDNVYTLGLDSAFTDKAVKPLEEWVLLASSQDAAFFTSLAGKTVPDPASGSNASKAFDPKSLIGGPSKNNKGKEALDQLKGLIGEEFVQTNYVSTAIPQDKEFNSGLGNPIRVLFRMKPGQKAVYVSGNPRTLSENPFGVKSKNPISYYNDGEMEMILPRNQTIKIIDVVPTTATGSKMYTIDVIVEVVDQPNV